MNVPLAMLEVISYAVADVVWSASICACVKLTWLKDIVPGICGRLVNTTFTLPFWGAVYTWFKTTGDGWLFKLEPFEEELVFDELELELESVLKLELEVES